MGIVVEKQFNVIPVDSLELARNQNYCNDTTGLFIYASDVKESKNYFSYSFPNFDHEQDFNTPSYNLNKPCEV